MPSRNHARFTAKAEAARKKLAEEERAIQSDPTLSPDQQRARLMDARDRLAATMMNIRQQRRDADKAELAQLRRRIYGFDQPQSEMARLSFRDAVARAQAITSSEEAEAACALAIDSGDTQMVKALAYVGEGRAWGSQVHLAWSATSSEVAELMEEFNQLEELTQDSRARLEDERELSVLDPAAMTEVPGGEGGGSPTLGG